MSKFTFVELFAGIGGVSFGFERLGGECVLAAEYDPERAGKRQFAQEAYQVLHPDVPMAGNVFELEAVDVPDHDVLSFTFPCQAFSLAGSRGGFEDARGTLVFEALRIANEKRPKVLFAENVKGLVNHDKGKTLDTIIRAMNDIGYVVDFDIMNSKYFGVPQNRERIFIVGIREDLIESEPFSEQATTGQTIIPKAKRRLAEWAVTFNFDWPEQGEVTTRLRDILEPVVDEKYYLDDERTAKLVAQLEGKYEDIKGMVRGGTQKNAYEGDGNLSPTITEAMGQGGGHVPLRVEPQMHGHDVLKGHDAINRTYSPEVISPTLATMGEGHREPKNAEVQAVGEIIVLGNTGASGLGNFNVYGTDGVGRTVIARDFKDAMRIAEIQEVRPVLTPDRISKRQNGRRFKEDGEESITLTSQDRHGVAIREATKKGYAIADEGDAVNFQFPNSKTRRGRVGKEIAQTLEASSINQGTPIKKGSRYRIRKLTPKECFRLQAFSDEAHQALVDAGISDSQRYKMAGNAVTVSVIEAIGARLLPIIGRQVEKQSSCHR